VPDANDSRSPLAIAMTWASQVTTIAAEMAVPALAGLWLDRKAGTGFVFVSLGAIVGLVLGLTSLIRLTQSPKGRGGDKG
jgi:hypothetical protein